MISPSPFEYLVAFAIVYVVGMLFALCLTTYIDEIRHNAQYASDPNQASAQNRMNPNDS